MPNNIINSFAKKSGKSKDEVEKLWAKAKAIAAEEGHEEDYPYIVGMLKKMLGIEKISESFSFSEYLVFEKFMKLQFDTSFLKGFKVELNDKKSHSLIDRIEQRTNLEVQKIKDIVKKILLMIKSDVLNGRITKRSMYEFKLLKSKIKILFLVNPDEYYIRFSTILNGKQYTKDTVVKELNEKFENYIKIELNF